MSLDRKTYFGYYVPLPNDMDISDDKWLPYIEGHEDCKFELIYENNTPLYFGITLGTTEKWGSDFAVIDLETKTKDMDYLISQELSNNELLTEDELEDLSLCKFILMDIFN